MLEGIYVSPCRDNRTDVGAMCHCKTLGLSYLDQQNPSDTSPFGITYMQMKSHLRYLLGLQEPSFCSSEGMGDDNIFHSYLFFLCNIILYCLFSVYLISLVMYYQYPSDYNKIQLQ
jgi:hypothetical protein